MSTSPNRPRPTPILRPKLSPRSKIESFRPRRLLVTTDFSPESKKVLPLASQLAELFQSEVDLLHVLEPAPRFAGSESVVLLPSPQGNRDDLLAGLTGLARSAFPPSVKVTPYIRTGKPVPQILRAARELKSDTLIMATHGYSGLTHVLLGSVTERVIRRAPCPVLTVRGSSRRSAKESEAPATIRQILLPTDLSASSQISFPLARSLAQLTGAQITLLYVVQRVPLDALLGTEMTRNTIGLLSQEAALELTALAKNQPFLKGLKVATKVCSGQPYHEITRAAQELDAGLIVMATHGHTGFKRAYLGSVAERVVQHSTCPVWSVKSSRLTHSAQPCS